MKTKIRITGIITLSIVAAIFLSHGQSYAQDISFVQNGEEIAVNETDYSYDEIAISPEAFDIVFKGKELHAVTGLTSEVYQYAKADTDINADFNSYFYIFKYLAMGEDSQFLPAGKDEAASLNATHGAKPEGKKHSKFTVAALQVEGEDKPVAELSEFFLALWLDVNKDQFIDESELMQVRVVIQ